jgi:hypothetical protein
MRRDARSEVTGAAGALVPLEVLTLTSNNPIAAEKPTHR